MNRDFLWKLRVLGMIEGTSTLVLFFGAMPLKYLYDQPLGVKIVGPIHGGLFVLLAIMCQLAVEKVPISPRLALAGVVGAVLPFGPFVVDHWLKQVGQEAEGSAPAGEQEA